MLSDLFCGSVKWTAMINMQLLQFDSNLFPPRSSHVYLMPYWMSVAVLYNEFWDTEWTLFRGIKLIQLLRRTVMHFWEPPTV